MAEIVVSVCVNIQVGNVWQGIEFESTVIQQVGVLYIMLYIKCLTYLDPGKNMDPLIKTHPVSKIYQHFEYSPVLKQKIYKI